jgi:hypothetical protein
VEGILDVTEEFSMFAGEEKASTHEVASGTHGRRIDVGHRNHAAAQQHGELGGNDGIVLRLGTVDGLEVECMGKHERDAVLCA